MRLRMITHFGVLEVVLLTLGNVMDLVKGSLNTILFAVQIAVVYGSVRFLSWMEDRKTANKINEKIKAMKEVI